MKPMISLLLATLFFAGCTFHAEECHYDTYGTYHCHEGRHSEATTTTCYGAHPESRRESNNIIIVEEQYCDDSTPFYHDPEYCSYSSESCCTWMGSDYGWEETWCFDDCEWYLYSYQQEASYF